jgi:hypothetical protein
MRDWANEEENLPYIGVDKLDSLMKKIKDDEEWLLEGEGEHAGHIEYNEKLAILNTIFNQLKMRKLENERR